MLFIFLLSITTGCANSLGVGNSLCSTTHIAFQYNQFNPEWRPISAHLIVDTASIQPCPASIRGKQPSSRPCSGSIQPSPTPVFSLSTLPALFLTPSSPPTTLILASSPIPSKSSQKRKPVHALSDTAAGRISSQMCCITKPVQISPSAMLNCSRKQASTSPAVILKFTLTLRRNWMRLRNWSGLGDLDIALLLCLRYHCLRIMSSRRENALCWK